MPDPTTHIGAYLGVKVASLVAGFAGGVVVLSFIQPLSKLQAFFAVLTGTLTAGYLTPAVIQYTGNAIPELSMAFIVGLTAMNLVNGLLRMSEAFKNSPFNFLKGRKL